MGYEIMYKKVFLKATDEMGVDLYTPVCLIGPNNVTQRHWTGNHYSERRCRDWNLMFNALALNKEELYDKFAHMMQPNRADCEMWKNGSRWVYGKDIRRWLDSGIASAVTIEDLLKANYRTGYRTGFPCQVVYYKGTEDVQLTAVPECTVIVRDTKAFLDWAKKAKTKEKELKETYKTDVFFCIDLMSEDIQVPSNKKRRSSEKVLMKDGAKYIENLEYEIREGKEIPHGISFTSDVKDAKVFTFEEASKVHRDFSMVFSSFKRVKLVSANVKSKPFDAIIAFEDVDGTEKFVAKSTRSRLFVALDEDSAKRYADKASAQKVCTALNEKKYSRSVKNGSFRVKFLIPC